MCVWADRSKALYGEDEIYNDGVMSLNADLMAKHWTAAFLQLNHDTLSFTTVKHKAESLIYQASWRLFLISRAALMQEKKNVLFPHIGAFIFYSLTWPRDTKFRGDLEWISSNGLWDASL